MANTVVVGAQWGDEAKGKIVDYLAADADVVIRYNGGNNAGHTVVVGSKIYKFHLVPSGVLRPDKTSVMASGEVIDPKVLLSELDALQEGGITADKLYISRSAHVIMPYHQLLDKLEEESKGSKAIGTTARGIGPVYADKASRLGIRMGDLIEADRFRQRLAANMELKNCILTRVYGVEPLDEQAVLEDYLAYGERLRPYVTDTDYIIYEAVKAGKSLLFEGAQGTLLDIDYGTYPYVTSSHTVSGGACLGTGVNPRQIDRVIGVAKSYTTRVGAGVFPTELFDEVCDYIRERGHEYGTTTGRPRRCGWMDTVALRYSAMVNGLTGIAMTLLDVLSGLDTVRICRAYRCDGTETDRLPGDWDSVTECVPIFDEMPGWKEDISGVREFADLPANAQAYTSRVEELAGVPVQYISVGADRSATIAR